MATTIKPTPLALQEIASHGGFNCMVVLTANHLTETVANTAQEFILPVKAGTILNKGMAILIVPFEDASDAANNTTTLIFGDTEDTNRYLASSQLNRNGTEIVIPEFTNTAYEVAVDTNLVFTLGSMAAKSLVNIDKGELHIYLHILDLRGLSLVKLQTPITK